MSTATDEQVEVTLTAAEIDRYALHYKMGHSSWETLGEYVARMREAGR